MFYHLLYPLNETISFFNIFQYITIRSIFAAVTAFILSLVLYPIAIKKLRALQFGETIREDGPKSHAAKQGTPTMGGLIILITVITSTLLWAKLDNPYILSILLGTFILGIVGFIDDFIKNTKNKKGLSGKLKIVGQILAGAGAIAVLYSCDSVDNAIITKSSLPFLKDFVLDYGWTFIPFTIFVVVASSNAVNLTDGLDGLSIGLITISFLGLAGIAYATGNMNFAEYLHMTYLPRSGELTIFATSVIGAGLGFLWYNAHPAQIFMGDTGSLPLGGAFGLMGILLKQEFLLIVLGGIFVVEALSVILQVGSYKLRGGKRIFKMAPIHHHFELSGWHENSVVVRFWIIGIILLILTLSILKVQ